MRLEAWRLGLRLSLDEWEARLDPGQTAYGDWRKL